MLDPGTLSANAIFFGADAPFTNVILTPIGEHALLTLDGTNNNNRKKKKTRIN